MDLTKYDRMGCDRIGLTDITVISADKKILIPLSNVRLEEQGKQMFKCYDGTQFKRLEIKDENVFCSFNAQMLKSSNGYWTQNVYLDICLGQVQDDNLTPWTIEHYQEYLPKVREYMEKQYGVQIDVSHARICSIEINATFALSFDFEKYERIFKLFMRALPKSLSFNGRAGADEKDESLMAQNTQRKVSIYDKQKELKDTGKEEPDLPLARIEQRLITTRKIRKSLGTDCLYLLQNQDILDYYLKTFEKEMVQPIYRWRKQNAKTLKNLMIEHKENDARNWQANLLNQCHVEEFVHKNIILLDIEDLLSVMQNNDRHHNYQRSKKSLLKKQVKRDDPYYNHDWKKIEEVIEKIRLIYEHEKAS